MKASKDIASQIFLPANHLPFDASNKAHFETLPLKPQFSLPSALLPKRPLQPFLIETLHHRRMADPDLRAKAQDGTHLIDSRRSKLGLLGRPSGVEAAVLARRSRGDGAGAHVVGRSLEGLWLCSGGDNSGCR